MREHEQIEKEIIKLGGEWADAMVANDVAAIGRFMHEDWVIVSDRGVSTKNQFLSFVESGALKHSSFDMSDQARIKVYGDIAVLTCRVINIAHFGGQTFEADEWATDVFVKEGSEWLCVHSHITAVNKDIEA